MSINQNIKYAQSDDSNNPQALYDFIKPMREIFDNGIPSPSFGENEWAYVDLSTSIQYLKVNGVWVPQVNWSSIISVPVGPIDRLEVNTIQGNATENIQIDLQTAGILSIGPTTALSTTQIQSDGTITTQSATASIGVSDLFGNQLIMQPLMVTGSPTLTMSASTDVSVLGNGDMNLLCGGVLNISAPSGGTYFSTGGGLGITEGTGNTTILTSTSITQGGAGDLSIASDNNVNITSGGSGQIVMTSAGGAVIVQPASLVVDTIFSPTTLGIAPTTTLSLSSGTDTSISASGIFYASSVGDLTIQNFAPSNMLLDTGGDMTLQGFVNNTVSAQTGAATVSGQTTATLISGSGSVVRAQTNNVTLQAIAGDINMVASGTITSSAPFYSGAGSGGAPTYSFSGDSNSGVYSVGADVVGVSAGGSVRLSVGTATSTLATHFVADANNTYDLGTNAIGWRNIYSNNLLNVISDARQKKEVEDLGYGLAFVKTLRPVKYKLIDQQDEVKHMGFIAQEVEDSLLKVGAYREEFDIVQEREGRYSMKYDSLISCLVNCVKELSARVEALEPK